jgi:hypothetical protein
LVSGANPTIASYNASVVNFYNATGSLARLENNILLYFEKRCSLLQRWRCRCKLKNRRIGSRFDVDCHPLAFRNNFMSACTRQGCQMVYFQTKSPNLRIFLEGLALDDSGIFYGTLVYFEVIWCIFPILVYCTRENLATVVAGYA